MPAGAEPRTRTAAFFDVDGTLVATTIVHYYMYFRRHLMSPLAAALWAKAYLLKCGYYLILDKVSRQRLNIVFYRGYAGLPVGEVKSQVDRCYRDVIQPRRFEQALPCIEEHRSADRDIVFVTGSIDFIIAPLAKELGVRDVLAPALIESDGVFTGDLDGPPIGEEEKASRIERFAREHSIDLAQSHAYGDSIADLPMLETVGLPHVVNPDKALLARARARRWPIHLWTLPQPRRNNGR